MVGQGRPTRYNQAHMTPQPRLDLGKHQLVEEWGGLQIQATIRLLHKSIQIAYMQR